MQIELNYDGPLDIATGKSRKEQNWKNKQVDWSKILNKLQETTRTFETQAEYSAMKKDRQDELKDVGGFVGGYLAGGKRNKTSVLYRQVLSLDADFATADLWEDFKMLYGCAAAMYTTHKHTSRNPRYRILIPLNRTVFCDEYQAIGRRIAGELGIEYFDNTGFEPSRLMYWPSSSKDGEYIFDFTDGPWLDADSILNTYRNWRDTSEWPVSDKFAKQIVNAAKKQGDPLDKPGVVGAFCRTYTVSEAIETFLSEVYEPCDDDDNRYTFKAGSTSGGLVIYENKFAYSHHGTDIISGKLCNAFDLVRLHLFGLQDENIDDDRPTNKLPSFTAMLDFAAGDKRVKASIMSDRLQTARSEFASVTFDEDGAANVVVVEEPANSDWLEGLDMDRNGSCYTTIDNIVHILTHDPYLKGRFALDTFEHREVAVKDLPWRKVHKNDRGLTDTDEAFIRHYLEKTYDIASPQKVRDGLDIIVNRNAYNPVKSYLSSLQWDGEPRLGTLLVDYLGAEDTEYVRAVTTKTFVAAVARIFNPGVKFDTVLVLVGPQGVGKSTIIKMMGMDWYSDSLTDIRGKEAFEQLQGSWIIELGELAGLRKAEVNQIKHFVAKQEDRYRVAYGRRVENFPRQQIFIGTTNNNDFLRDLTGNRRFWPVNVQGSGGGRGEHAKRVFSGALQQAIPQLWAEAVQLFKAREPLYLPAHLEQTAERVQDRHIEHDDRVGMVEYYLNTKLPEQWLEWGLAERRSWLSSDEAMRQIGKLEREEVSVMEIWCECMGGRIQDLTTSKARELHDIMRRLTKWERSDSRKSIPLYGKQTIYNKTVKTRVLAD